MACLAPLLVLLMGSTDLLAVNGCHIYGAVGQDLVLPFTYTQLDLSHVLRWTHNKTIVFNREQSRVFVGKATDVSASGSLMLNDLQFSSSGDYQADVLNRNNKPVTTWSGRVCVLARVSKPQLSSVCDFPVSALCLNCHVAQTQGVEFSWTVDGKSLANKTEPKLIFPLAKVKAGMSFMCSATNVVSSENSDIVRHTCSSPATQADQYCFRVQAVQAVFAGGAGVVLLLLTIIITLCCRRQRQRPQGARNAEEFRMWNARNVQKPGSVNLDYETMLSPEKPQGQSSEQRYHSTVPEHEDKTENRLSHHPVAEEEKRSSPVPKPRTKIPQTANA